MEVLMKKTGSKISLHCPFIGSIMWCVLQTVRIPDRQASCQSGTVPKKTTGNDGGRFERKILQKGEDLLLNFKIFM
jgi:hypothetical protein